MLIKSYNRKQLEEFINDDLFKSLSEIPISYKRALSQINNPCCNDEDILLWAAFENCNLLGYVGVLPDEINYGTQLLKVYWLSCFWVEESYRSENLASQLFFSLIKQYKKQLLISNFLFSLENTYQKLGVFQATQSNPGYCFYIKFCFSELILARFPKFKPILSIYRISEFGLNVILNVRKVFFRKPVLKYEIIELNTINDELDLFLKNYSDKYVKRDAEYFRWVLKYPWLITGSPDKESARYFFSTKSKQFEYRILQIKDKLETIGFVLMKVRDKKMTISYLYVNNKVVDDLANYLTELSFVENINSITTYDNKLSEKLHSLNMKFVFIKKTKRLYIFPNNFQIKSAAFQEGDGDSVFT